MAHCCGAAHRTVRRYGSRQVDGVRRVLGLWRGRRRWRRHRTRGRRAGDRGAGEAGRGVRGRRSCYPTARSTVPRWRRSRSPTTRSARRSTGSCIPLVAKRRAELIDAAPADAVIVEDIPLLVESQMAPMFPLVVIVHADVETRVARLLEHRGFSETDARTRIAAQATEEQRRAVADVWLDNSGSADGLRQRAVDLWHDRIVPFAHNVAAGERAHVAPRLVPSDPTWPDQARRIVNRLNTACGHRAVRIDHIGSTAVPGLDAKDVIDVQVTVASLDVADELDRRIAGRRVRPRGREHGRCQAGRPQHGRRVRPHGRSRVVAQADSRCPRIREGRPTCTCGSTGGPVSSSRCCSATG